MHAERIAKARDDLAQGRLGSALGGLMDVKDTTREPETLREVHELALEGLAQAGRFSKGSWRSLADKTEEKLGSLETAVAAAS